MKFLEDEINLLLEVITRHPPPSPGGVHLGNRQNSSNLKLVQNLPITWYSYQPPFLISIFFPKISVRFPSSHAMMAVIFPSPLHSLISFPERRGNPALIVHPHPTDLISRQVKRRAKEEQRREGKAWGKGTREEREGEGWEGEGWEGEG